MPPKHKVNWVRKGRKGSETLRDHKKFEVKIDPSGGEFTMTENNFGPAAHFRLLIMVYAELCSALRCSRVRLVVVFSSFGRCCAQWVFWLESLICAHSLLARNSRQLDVVGQNFVSDVRAPDKSQSALNVEEKEQKSRKKPHFWLLAWTNGHADWHRFLAWIVNLVLWSYQSTHKNYWLISR